MSSLQVAVTARWAPAAGKTEAWLAGVGLGGLPVVYATGPHVGDDSRIGFKASAIEALRAGGLSPTVGIGDRPSDLRAYLRASIVPCMVAHAQSSGGAHAAAAHCVQALHDLRNAAQHEPRAPIHYFTDSAPAAAVHGAVCATTAAPLPPVWKQLHAFLAALR